MPIRVETGAKKKQGVIGYLMRGGMPLGSAPTEKNSVSDQNTLHLSNMKILEFVDGDAEKSTSFCLNSHFISNERI